MAFESYFRVALSGESKSRKEIKGIKVVIVLGIHLFPFRTEKLSPTASMVLRKSGRVDSCRFKGGVHAKSMSSFFYYTYPIQAGDLSGKSLQRENPQNICLK